MYLCTVLHRDHDARAGRSEIHSAARALDHLTLIRGLAPSKKKKEGKKKNQSAKTETTTYRDDPVCEIAKL